MPETNLSTRLEMTLEPVVREHGLELVAVEQAGGRREPVIRVLLDCENGIDIDTIATANRWISEILDLDEGLTGPYVLEVSSPGIDRPLHKPADFARFIGESATVKTRTESGRATLTGQIASADETGITLVADGEEHRISYDHIVKARLKGAVDFATGRSDKPQ
jgi:ribosome maturation factor RimP